MSKPKFLKQSLQLASLDKKVKQSYKSISMINYKHRSSINHNVPKQIMNNVLHMGSFFIGFCH